MPLAAFRGTNHPRVFAAGSHRLRSGADAALTEARIPLDRAALNIKGAAHSVDHAAEVKRYFRRRCVSR